MQSPLEFRLVFEKGSGLCLLLSPGAPFTILAVTDAYLRATGLAREALVGRTLFEVFSDDPAAPQSQVLRDLRRSLEGVLATKQPDATLPVQRYDLPRSSSEEGGLEARYWRPTQMPLLSSEGEVRYLLHQVEDVTWEERARRGMEAREVVHLARSAELSERERLLEALQRSEARYRVLFESIDDGYCLMQLLFDAAERAVDYRFLETNAAFEEHTGLKGARGRTARELVPDLDESWFRIYGGVALTGVPARFENHAPAMGRWFEVFANRVGPPEERLVALVFKNVTARKEAELERERALASETAARAEAEAQRRTLHDLFMQAPVPIAILEAPRHTFSFANPHYRAIVGNRDVVGRSVAEAFPDVMGQGFDALLDRVVATGEPFFGNEIPVHLEHLPRDQPLLINLVYAPKRNAAGVVDGVLVSASDVTAQVRAREGLEALARSLRESEERLRRVVDITGVGTWEVDPIHQSVVADARFRELFGLRPDEPFSLEGGFAIVHPEDGARVAKAVQDALAGEQGGHYFVEYRTVGPHDGRVRWVEARGEAFFAPDGKATRFLGTGVDITWRKEAEAVQTRLLEALGDQPLLYVALLRGQELRFEMANALYRKVVGGRDVVGKTLHEALPELRGQGIDTLLRRVLETGEPFIGRETLVVVDRRGLGPEDSYFTQVYHAVRGTSGANEAVLAIGQDVTDEVLARREARRLEKERSAFEQQLIGIVSHDLKNPLNAILLGTATLIQREELNEKSLKRVVRIQTSAERMGRMVRDLLDFTQARLGGGIPLNPAPMDLHALVHQTVEEVRMSAPERALRVETEGDGEGAWDADRLAQVVQNLVSNALKYSPEGTPVTVRTRGEEGWITLEVHNEGPPFSPQTLARLFQPMERFSSLVDRTGRSVGLGLYIVKHIVDAHGGAIDVRSSAEEGITFRVRLPRRGA